MLRGNGPHWSCGLLSSLTRLNSLHTLEIPTVPREWAVEVGASTHQPFRSLATARTVLTDHGSESLLQLFQSVRSLMITLANFSTSILRACQDLPDLEELSIDYGNLSVSSTLKSSELVSLARSCQKCPVAINLSDTHIQELAQALPNLQSLRLHARDQTITEKSICHLGNYCKSLVHLNLSVYCVDFEALILAASSTDDPRILFPDLLYFHFSEDVEQNILPWTPSQEIGEIAHRLRSIMPRCRHFSCENQREWGMYRYGNLRTEVRRLIRLGG